MTINWTWILDRLSENSTWRGIIGLATAAGVLIDPAKADKIIAGGLAIVGVINMLRTAPPTSAAVAKAIDTGDTQHLKPTDPKGPNP